MVRYFILLLLFYTIIPAGKLQIKFTDDFYKSGVSPDQISIQPYLIGKRIIIKPRKILQKKFKMGWYLLCIKKMGYYRFSKIIFILPRQNNIKIKLKSKPRPLIIKIMSYTEGDGTEKILMNGFSIPKNKPIKIKTGVHKLEVIKTGYERYFKELLIPPDEYPYITYVYLTLAPREILFYFYHKGERIYPDRVEIRGKDIKNGETLLPNHYVIGVYKKGYQNLELSVFIEPSDKPYIIKGYLIK